MEWGVVHGWLNTLLLGAIGAGILLSGRWRHLRWLPCYALCSAALSAAYRLWFHGWEFYLPKYYITALLLLLASREIARKELNKEPWWTWPALVNIVFIAFLPVQQTASYYLSQSLLVIGLAGEYPSALRARSGPMLALSVMAMASVMSDVLKTLKPWREAFVLMRAFDPWSYTAMGAIMLAFLFRPELEAVGKALAKRLGSTFRLQAARAFAPGGEGARPRDYRPSEQGYYAVPLRAVGSSHEEPAGGSETFDEGTVQRILDRLDTLEAAIATAARIALVTRKTFLSPLDLVFYLGIEEDAARAFVAEKGIERIYLTGDNEHWVVLRADIDEFLSEDTEHGVQ